MTRTRTSYDELPGILARIEVAKNEGRRGEHDEFALLGRWAYQNRDLLERALGPSSLETDVRC